MLCLEKVQENKNACLASIVDESALRHRRLGHASEGLKRGSGRQKESRIKDILPLERAFK